MLQLAHGFEHQHVRRRETLTALKALREEKIIDKKDYAILADGYLFLRRLDHRLRLERDQSIDGFERSPERLEGIARALGYKGRRKQSGGHAASAGEKLLAEYEKRREQIRACYERYFLADTTRH
jgi:glutamate-ammonia-ligase adenylyltransferase